MRISYNALTGNIETLNEFEGDGIIQKVIRPERESLQSSFKTNDWLFAYEGELYDEMISVERQAEADVRALMLGNESTGERLKSGFYDV